MKRNTKIFCLLQCLLCIAVGSVWAADEVVFKANAPSQVIVGRPFQLTYSVNQRSKDLRAPEITDFDVLAGPYTSTSSSTSFVNGKRTSSFSQTYTYTLMAQRTGTFTIAPATIRVSGDEYTSNGVRITVLPEDEQPAQQSQASKNTHAQQTSNGNSGNSGNVSSENLFIRTIVSKTRVHEQEAILLSYKLYFAGVDVAQFTNNTKIPEFTGFLKQDLEQSEIQTELENYNGRNYQTATLYRTLLYPQHSGDIKIDPAQFEAVLRVQTRAQVRSIFDDFFGTYTNVTRAITAPGVTVHVDALPSGKPAGFSGGVGHFSLTPQISQTEVQTNDAVTIRIDITGTGNMKLLKTPTIDWPEGFEPYDPKVTNNFKTTPSGVSGTKSIEYLAIPRASGDYTIPAVSFSYFDTQDDTYKTLSTPEYTLHVKKGANEQSGANSVVNNYVNKEDIKQLGSDIRYINTVAPTLKVQKEAAVEYGSWIFWLLYIVPLCAALLVFAIFHKRIKENADTTRVRYKRANKVAQKRLKQAGKLLKDNQKEAFYEEIERAAWTYLSDRLSIPTADLNKDNIASILHEKGVSDELIKEVNDVLSTAEFARYAPSSDHAMDDMYKATGQLIDRLENEKL
ncbi:MAG: BatD family protein [Bacteroidales bacterium]|nr:BatD family protein [Bacteroidales bacterium]